MNRQLLTIYLSLISICLFAQEDKQTRANDLKQNIILKAELEKEELVIGEQVTLNLAIYTKVGIEEVQILSNFTLIEKGGLQINPNYEFNSEAVTATLDGEHYMKKILAQYLVYPWVEGKFQLASPKVLIGRVKTNNKQETSTELIYDSLTIQTPFSINVVPPKDKSSSYVAKNGFNIISRYNDSLVEKGIILVDLELYGKGNPMFYSPPDFELEDIATVDVQLIEDGIKIIEGVCYDSRSYHYIISFHKKGDYKLKAIWNSFNTRNQEWEINYSDSHYVQIKNTRFRKDSNTNIGPTKTSSSSIEDVIFVVDLSTSMLAKDFVPNRLEAVKALLKEMIKQKEAQQKMGLVIFAGEAMTLCPLTQDSITLLKSVETIEVGKLENGTAIGNGLMFGLYELSKSNNEKRHLFVLTDGVQNSGTHSPQIAAQIANMERIQIHSFGVGCNSQAMTPIAQRPNGEFIYDMANVVIDEKILNLIGEQTGGIYSRVTCNSDLKTISSLRELIDNAKPSPRKTTSISSQLIEIIWQDVELNNAKAQLKYWK